MKNYGLEIQDTPVLAHGRVRHHGEPVALVAADHPETARRAAAKIRIEYRELPVITDEASATAPDAVLVHENRDDHHIGHVPHPNIVHRQPIIRGDADKAAERADVIVTGEYTFGMQDQAFLGPESGLAVPSEDGGVELYVATQWLHSDLKQIAPRPRPPRGQGPHDALRRRRGLRRTRGHLDADPRLPAGAPHRQARQDRLQPVRVLLRTRPPAPGEAPLRARRHQGRQAHAHEVPHRPGRRGLRLRLPGRRRQRLLALGRPVPDRGRRHRGDRPLHQQPALRRDARLRRGPGVLRLRGPDGQARREARHGPGRVPAAQRHGTGHPPAHRPALRLAPRSPNCCAGSRPARCRPSRSGSRLKTATAPPSTSAPCPAASPTPPTAKASCGASATRSA